MHFGFALELSDIDLWNIDLLDTHLDLLDTDIPSKNFVCLHSVFRMSSRYVFKTSSRHVFKTPSGHVFKTSSRRLCKTSSRRLGRRRTVTLKTCWRRLEDMSWRHVFKTSKVFWVTCRSSLPKMFCKKKVFLKIRKFHGKTYVPCAKFSF